MTSSPVEVRERWHEHFSEVLNITSTFSQQVMDELPIRRPHTELDYPPTKEELLTALGKLKLKKAGGKSGILPELLVCGGADLEERLLQLMTGTWEEDEVVDDWRDAIIVPIPKKGDLTLCDNWRGISLLDVVGKVFLV